MIDLTGQRFERWTVIEHHHVDKHGTHYWKCRCDCGTEAVVPSCRLRYGLSKSCGCYSKEVAKKTCVERNTTHGASSTRLYHIWCNMKQRCCNQSHPDYIRWYGSRGITLCEAWKNDFQAFHDWSMANGYADNLTIDRIDCNGNYCPENCRWVTPKEQANNTRHCHMIEWNGETHTISEWARKLNMSPQTLVGRLNVYGYSVEKAFTEPVTRHHPRKKAVK